MTNEKFQAKMKLAAKIAKNNKQTKVWDTRTGLEFLKWAEKDNVTIEMVSKFQ